MSMSGKSSRTTIGAGDASVATSLASTQIGVCLPSSRFQETYMRLTVTTFFCASLIAISIASPATAQVTEKGWYCADDRMHDTCDGQAACDAAWARHLDVHHAGGTQRGPVPPRQPRTPAVIVATAPFVGGALGALVGSFETSTAGNEQWENGAIFGAGAVTVAAVTANANKINPVVGAGMAIVGGAAAGTAWARYQIEQGKPDTTKRDALIGGGVGFATWGIGKLAIGPASPNLAPLWMGPKSKLNFILTGRWLGVIIRW